jgi:phage/plasmid-like protein (TIGR03299 family)
MAHLIENMAFAGETPWHTLGTKVDGNISSNDMIVAAGLDWTVEQWPCMATDGNRRLIVEDSQQNVRVMKDGSFSSLGTVGNKTHVLQNVDAFAAFEPYIQAGEAIWETAGSLDDGKKVWVLARVTNGDAQIRANDSIASFLTITNPHDGSGSVRIGFTPIRIVCANTLRMAHNSKESKLIRINHSRHVKTRVDDLAATMDLVRREFAMSAEKYTWLASRKSINKADLEAYTRAVFNLGDKPTIDLSSTAQSKLFTINELFESGIGNRGESWYDAYNAVTEYLSHRAGRSVDTRYNSLWYGSAANTSQLALDTALEMAV